MESTIDTILTSLDTAKPDSYAQVYDYLSGDSLSAVPFTKEGGGASPWTISGICRLVMSKASLTNVFGIGGVDHTGIPASKITGTYQPLIMTTGGSERMRIDTAGKVGIGTNAPVAKLDVNG